MNDNAPVARLYSIQDAASLLGSISPWTLRKHIASGTIRVTRLGKRVFLRSEEIERIREQGLPPLRPERLSSMSFIAEAHQAGPHGEIPNRRESNG